MSEDHDSKGHGSEGHGSNDHRSKDHDSRRPQVDSQDLENDEDSMELPIDGTLDLHMFLPRDVKTLVPGYLQECRARGILEVRIIHGKGIGALRETVHAILDRLPYVEGYRLGGSGEGEWGATIVRLGAGKSG